MIWVTEATRVTGDEGERGGEEEGERGDGTNAGPSKKEKATQPTDAGRLMTEMSKSIQALLCDYASVETRR